MVRILKFQRSSFFNVIIDKKGTCPVLPTFKPLCASDVDECFMDYDCVKEMKCCSNGCYKICIPPADDAVTAPAAAGKTLDSMTAQSYKSVFIVSNHCKKKRISFTLPPIGVGRGKGSWGTRKPPLKAFLGKQPTIFR